ncbi:MAG: S8 family serine peptidase [Geminicoccaceae bacterium]
MSFRLALEYILVRARDIQKQLNTAVNCGGDKDRTVPVVVNFSYGILGGSHDGKHVIEKDARSLIEAHKTAGGGEVTLAIPAGNSNLQRGHCRSEPGVASLRIPWRLQPDDQTSSFLEVWVPKEVSKLTLKLVAPNGQTVSLPDAPVVELQSGKSLNLIKAPFSPAKNGIVGSFAFSQPDQGGKKQLFIAMAATTKPNELPANSQGTLASGIWDLEVTAVNMPSNGRIEAWILRDDSPLGARIQARQSYFDDAEFRRFTQEGDVKSRDIEDPWSAVRHAGTLNGMATDPNAGADDPIFVVGAVLERGGYPDDPDSTQDDAQEVAYSSTSGPEMRDPDIAAHSDSSRALGGKVVAGSRRGSSVVLNGTSVAAPQLARWIADQYAMNPAISPSAMRTKMKTSFKDTTLAVERTGERRLPVDRYPLKVDRRTFS